MAINWWKNWETEKAPGQGAKGSEAKRNGVQKTADRGRRKERNRSLSCTRDTFWVVSATSLLSHFAVCHMGPSTVLSGHCEQPPILGNIFDKIYKFFIFFYTFSIDLKTYFYEISVFKVFRAPPWFIFACVGWRSYLWNPAAAV